jgi:organic radical activating enzyme
MAVDDVYQKIVDLGCPKVTVTGGEPLVQYWETLALIDLLLDNDFYVSVETNGTFFPPPIYLQNRQLSWVFDYKLEFPDKMQSMAMQSIVSPIHWIKIVVEDEKKYRQAILIKDWLRRVGGCRASFAFSPAFGDPGLPPSELAYWLIRDKQWDVWLNVQLHKLIAVR